MHCLTRTTRPTPLHACLIFSMSAGLKFARWVRQAAYLPQCSRLAGTQLAPRFTQLPERDQYSAMELFRGSMLRHNVILNRKDTSSSGRQVDFREPGWKNYVPIRIADVICVQERLPREPRQC